MRCNNSCSAKTRTEYFAPNSVPAPSDLEQYSLWMGIGTLVWKAVPLLNHAHCWYRLFVQDWNNNRKEADKLQLVGTEQAKTALWISRDPPRMDFLYYVLICCLWGGLQQSSSSQLCSTFAYYSVNPIPPHPPCTSSVLLIQLKVNLMPPKVMELIQLPPALSSLCLSSHFFPIPLTTDLCLYSA